MSFGKLSLLGLKEYKKLNKRIQISDIEFGVSKSYLRNNLPKEEREIQNKDKQSSYCMVGIFRLKSNLFHSLINYMMKMLAIWFNC